MGITNIISTLFTIQYFSILLSLLIFLYIFLHVLIHSHPPCFLPLPFILYYLNSLPFLLFPTFPFHSVSCSSTSFLHRFLLISPLFPSPPANSRTLLLLMANPGLLSGIKHRIMVVSWPHQYFPHTDFLSSLPVPRSLSSITTCFLSLATFSFSQTYCYPSLYFQFIYAIHCHVPFIPSLLASSWSAFFQYCLPSRPLFPCFIFAVFSSSMEFCFPSYSVLRSFCL